jgi:xanthine dehydrogenase YagS FAD-binding subunit
MSSLLEWPADGSLRLAGTAPLGAIAGDARVLDRFPLLAQACERPDRPGVPGEITLGEDLAQRGRCPYLQQGAHCLKNGGVACDAIDGGNRELAILDGGPSWIVHPSDAAVALVALDAMIEISGGSVAREVAAADFFVLPTERLDAESVLRDGERVVAVRLPGASAGGVQRFAAARNEDTGLVQVSLAAVRRADGEVRLVLGSVSPRPYRVYNSIEEETTTGGLDEETIEGLAERALLDAQPLSQNGFKVELAAALLRDAIRALAAP